MKLTAYTSAGEAHALDEPVSLTIDRAMDAPADRLEVSFPDSASLPELDTLYVERDGQAVFYGIVDEQSVEYSKHGGLLRLSARSLAAALLDNESLVHYYEKPTLLEIFNRHAKPHGILGLRGSSLAYNGTFAIGKGQSDWSVLTAFCRGVGGLRPRITPDRYLDVRLTAGEYTIKYSNADADGIRFASVSHNIKRCKPVDTVLLRSADGGSYQFTEQNPVVHGKGINRRRLMEIRSGVGMVQRSAKELIRESNYEYEQYFLRTAGDHLPQPGNRAALHDARLGTVQNLVVAGASYRRSHSGEFSDIILIPERNQLI